MPLFVRSFCVIAAALATAACSVTANVTGYVGAMDQVYNGKATGYSDHTGDIEMTSASGVRCVGNYN